MSTDVEVLDELQEFERRRKEGIGSTDSAAILGVTPWKSAYDVWLDKTTDRPPKDPTLPKWLGLKLQSAIAELYTASMDVGTISDQTQYKTPNGIVRAHVDYRVETEPGLSIVGVYEDHSPILECKTSRSRKRWGKPMTEEVPRWYWIQVQHQMACLPEAPYADIAVLIGNDDFRVFRIKRDQPFIDQLVVDMEAWWQRHVVERVPPPVDGSSAAERYLRDKYPTHRSNMLPATADVSLVAQDLLAVKQTIAEGEAAEAVLKQKLMDIIGDHEGAFGPGWKITWKQNKGRADIDYPAIVDAMRVLLKRHGYEDAMLDGIVSQNREFKVGARPFIIEAVEVQE